MMIMRTLFHYWLCPYSRKIRLLLAEKKLDFELELEHPWERNLDFLKMNPAAQVPVLKDLNGSVLCDSAAITEYLDETYVDHPMIGKDPLDRAEARRLQAWFDTLFFRDVWMNLVGEKVLKRVLPSEKSSGPDSAAIRRGKTAIHHHLEYISWLADRRKWLAGDTISIADLAAAAHFSCIDYLGDVPWDQFEVAKDWYARLKSRPSFRPLLGDRIPGIRPPEYYANLDF